jgi:hypothetical protein
VEIKDNQNEELIRKDLVVNNEMNEKNLKLIESSEQMRDENENKIHADISNNVNEENTNIEKKSNEEIINSQRDIPNELLNDEDGNLIKLKNISYKFIINIL